MLDAYSRLGAGGSKKVVIAGAGLAGLSAATYLVEQGFKVTLLEKREVAGGKVSSWQDADGDWRESGLHVFFGAYHNPLAFLRVTGLDDALAWMPHALTFSQRQPPRDCRRRHRVPGHPAQNSRA